MSKDKNSESDIDKLVEKAKQEIPSVDAILEEAMGNLQISTMPQEKVLKDFGNFVSELESEAWGIYKKHENAAFKKLVRIIREGKHTLADDELETLVTATRRLEFVAGQMRKARGGVTFQKIIQKLLNLAGVPCETPHKETKKVLRRIDLVSPTADMGKSMPDKAIFLAVKRTLRERWKQVVPEQMKGARLYLVTINGECSAEKAQEIKEAGLIAYVPEHLKNQKHLIEKPWVRSLSSLPQDVGNL
ncbi:MAG: type II restriction endonuclease [Dehalococcoidia bacterium]|nr:type II restriction endonuclease [Dehalococcoidia bacterium]